MPSGTGLSRFQGVFPDRMIDVGIAEEHAVTMCAGMAAGGMRPYFAVYASFFQRGYDQMIHDVCMQKLPVCFLLDRRGWWARMAPRIMGYMTLRPCCPSPT